MMDLCEQTDAIRRHTAEAILNFTMDVPDKGERQHLMDCYVDKVNVALHDVPGHRVLITLQWLSWLLVSGAMKLDAASYGKRAR